MADGPADDKDKGDAAEIKNPEEPRQPRKRRKLHMPLTEKAHKPEKGAPQVPHKDKRTRVQTRQEEREGEQVLHHVNEHFECLIPDSLHQIERRIHHYLTQHLAQEPSENKMKQHRWLKSQIRGQIFV